MEQRERIKKKKEEERRKMMEDETSSNERKVTNIVLQDDGIHDSTFPHEEKESEEKVASE